MKVKTQDLSHTLKGYSNKWLALQPRSMKVIAVGEKLPDVLKKARESGESNPIVTRAPKDYGAYIL